MIDYILLFFALSMLGWLVEVLEGIVNRKEFINRGFLVGPICPIYGVGSLLMLNFLRAYESDYIVLFIMGMIICTILEYLTSLILEKIFHTRWWDYSDHKINLNGRVALETMVMFGLSSIILMKLIKPFYFKIINIIPNNIKLIIVIILIIIFVIDIAFSISVIIKIKKNKLIKNIDCTREVKKHIKNNIIKRNYLIRRLLKSFPLLRGKKD